MIYPQNHLQLLNGNEVYLLIIIVFSQKLSMKLNKKDNLELNTDTSPREKSKSKSDLGNILSKSKESELII